MKDIKNFMVIFCISLLSITASAQSAGVKPLTFVAVEKGDVNQLKALVDAGANVNEVYEGVSLLNKACGGVLKVNNDIVKILLDSPKINVKTITITDPDIDKSWATTPLVALLSSASYNSKLDNVVRLIKMGVDINYHSEFNNKFDALIVATFGKNPGEESKAVTMAILNNAGPKLNVNYMGKYNATGYLDAVQSQHAEAVEAILKRGAKVEGVNPDESWNGMIPETIDHDNFDILDIIMKYKANKYGPTIHSRLPLNAAMIQAKQANWADYFITKYKVDVNHLGKAGTLGDEPAVNVAASFNNVEGLKILVKNGANINLATSQGINAIQMAAQHNSLDAAKYLIEQKAILNGYNSVFFNAISYAALGYHLEMLDLLVKSGADVNEVSKESPWAGPLARLAMSFSPVDKKVRLTISKLLELGANPNVLHAQDMTAIMCAAKLGTSDGWKAAVDVCEILIKNHANVNLANTAGETALMLASQSGNSKLVNLLIKSGAEVNAVNKVGDSALSYANNAAENKSDIVKALENAGVKPVVASARSVSKSLPGNLVGTWKGFQTNDKIIMATFVVNKNNTYSYSAVGKVNGSAVSFSHKGEIVVSDDTYTLKPAGQASSTYSYKIVNGKLSVNNGRPLDKVK